MVLMTMQVVLIAVCVKMNEANCYPDCCPGLFDAKAKYQLAKQISLNERAYCPECKEYSSVSKTLCSIAACIGLIQWLLV